MSSRRRFSHPGKLPSPRGFETALLQVFLVALVTIFFPNVRASSAPTDSRPTVILLVGAPGEPEYGSNFLHQATLWQKACSQGETRTVSLGLDASSTTNDLEFLRQTLADESKESPNQLWLVLIGHGTFDGKEGWFNLRGPDLSSGQLATWLAPFRRPLAVLNTASSSGPFIAKLSGTNRVIVTATRSGSEQNYARFGQYFAEALTDSQADLDQDGQVSLLEAFLTASHHVNDFYKAQGRLVTEHALLDDNGDSLGTPADWFRGLRATKRAKDGAALDGLLAQQFRLVPGAADRGLSPEQIAQRDSIEKEILLHREKKAQIPEDEYYQELEKLLLQLAKFYVADPATNSPR